MMSYEISTDAARLDRAAIHRFISTTYWAQDIPRAVLDRALAHSLCIGTYLDGAQVGFARIVTDEATFAYLADVFVEPAHRGQGLARRMVQALIDLPQTQGLRRWLLATRDAHGVYAPLGFKPVMKPQNLMERRLENPYGMS